jgi:hypothetical protein
VVSNHFHEGCLVMDFGNYFEGILIVNIYPVVLSIKLPNELVSLDSSTDATSFIVLRLSHDLPSGSLASLCCLHDLLCNGHSQLKRVVVALILDRHVISGPMVSSIPQSEAMAAVRYL